METTSATPSDTGYPLTVIIPAYNEETALAANMPALLAFCEQYHYRLIIVNDGSHDRTQSILEQYAASPLLTIVRNKVNKGYGGAVKAGIRQAATRYAVTADADGQHNLHDLRRLHEEIAGRDADMVVGSRKGLKSASAYRGLGKWLIRAIANVLMPVNVYDINSGMKIYDTALAQKYIRLCPDTMAFSDIITLVFISQRHLVLEVPITINPRSGGKSTITTMTAVDTVKEILSIVLLFNPMKIFFPISLASITAGFAWGIPLVLQGRGISVGFLLAFVVGLFFFLLGLVTEQLSMLRKSHLD